MLTSGLAFNAGGAIACKRFTLTNNDTTTVGTAQTVALFTLPKGSMVIGVRIKGRTAFAGTSITALTVSVGTTSLGATGLASAFDILQAVLAGRNQMSQCFKQGPDADEVVNAYFTSTGANLSAMTAGKCDIDVIYLNQTTPEP